MCVPCGAQGFGAAGEPNGGESIELNWWIARNLHRIHGPHGTAPWRQLRSPPPMSYHYDGGPPPSPTSPTPYAGSAAASAPSYHTGSLQTPSYTRAPRLHEQVLGVGGTTRPRLSGTYSQRENLLALTLESQEEGCVMPAFGRGALIRGTVAISPKATSAALSLEVTVSLDVLRVHGTI